MNFNIFKNSVYPDTRSMHCLICMSLDIRSRISGFVKWGVWSGFFAADITELLTYRSLSTMMRRKNFSVNFSHFCYISGLLRRRHSSYHRHVEPPLMIVRFRLLRRVPGILFQLWSGKSSHCLRSAGNWWHHCSPSIFRQTDRDII